MTVKGRTVAASVLGSQLAVQHAATAGEFYARCAGLGARAELQGAEVWGSPVCHSVNCVYAEVLRRGRARTINQLALRGYLVTLELRRPSQGITTKLNFAVKTGRFSCRDSVCVAE